MQKKPLMFCGFTAMMGIFGAFLRWLQNMLAFEEDTLLAVTYSPWHFIVILYLLGFAVFLWRFVQHYKEYEMPMQYPDSFRCDSKIWKMSSIFFSILMCFGALIAMFRSVTTDKGNIFELVLGLFAVVCAINFMSFVNGTRGKNPKNGGFASIVIVIFFCYRLIATYKQFAADPVIWHFAIQLLAVSAVLLAFYYIAGFAYKLPKKLSTLFFAQFGAFLSIVSCADSVSIGHHMLAVSAAGMLLLISYAQLSNMHSPNELKDSSESI